METSLQFNIHQQLTLTPQLQQAIRLLQLSSLDLQQEIQKFVESNPMLEIQGGEEKEAAHTESASAKEALDYQELSWSSLQTPQRQNNFDSPDYNYENLYAPAMNLHEHLHWQLELTPMSDTDKMIATALIDAVNPDGFLTLSIQDLQESLIQEKPDLDREEIEAVRHLIQHFDPLGCASTDLREALLVQLKQEKKISQPLELAKKIIEKDLELLGQHNYRQLMKNHQITEKQLYTALKLIKKLQPKPGAVIQTETTQYVIPDIFVKKFQGEWQVFLNQNSLPRLSINQQYASLIQRADDSQDNQFLKSNLQEARWFLKSIQSRQETLLKVAQAIVNYQKAFLEQGEEAMKPLILNNVAQTLGMHESTISRVTTQKYMHTPRGVFELKYFFSSHVSTINGEECSSTAIRALIKKLIAEENKKKPLSDNKIAQLIAKQGIQVARRTVAKYREEMSISPSNERKMIGT